MHCLVGVSVLVPRFVVSKLTNLVAISDKREFAISLGGRVVLLASKLVALLDRLGMSPRDGRAASRATFESRSGEVNGLLLDSSPDGRNISLDTDGFRPQMRKGFLVRIHVAVDRWRSFLFSLRLGHLGKLGKQRERATRGIRISFERYCEKPWNPSTSSVLDWIFLMQGLH